MDMTEKKYLVEALLFISGDPVTIEAMKTITELPETELKQLLDELTAEYRDHKRGMQIIEVANAYQMTTNPAYAPWIRKLTSSAAPNKLSMPALETLAIIAYNQPIIKADVEHMRGVNSDGVIKSLLDRRLIKIMGRKEVPGKPLLYGTTKEFLQYFGLKDLTELPTLKELTRDEAA
ncbi:MAG: SMC-Scp complex subunit ScpB [Nitrospirae bacterium]|nr:MAG: SMC-Scp complex subunit ScpB [Nitrospirota bacterium]